MKSDPIEERQRAFRNGIAVAAHFVDDYNSRTMHPYRLGDCILAEFSLRRGTPRRNAMNPDLLRSCKYAVSTTANKKIELWHIAQLIDPDSWNQYARNKVNVAPEVTERLNQSIALAKRVQDAGYRNCATSREAPPKVIEYKESKRRRTSGTSGLARRRGA